MIANKDKLNELTNEKQNGLPVWVRAPAQGQEHYTGFTRGKLYELAAKGIIRTASIRHPGQLRGTRIFNLQSILDCIERNEIQPKDAAQQAEAA